VNDLSGTLYVVGTPIGNLGDFSPRAIETLENCVFIAAEDTRVTLKLLNRFEIKKPMVSYFEHNRFERGPVIAQRILEGENIISTLGGELGSAIENSAVTYKENLKKAGNN
jgi:16S rRNA (cytidine1402-2'-O)-methyltransferase